jgi:glycosyltransferase involved in cell wall biosynthesis
MRPTVSIVMAAKNYARFLPQAVESVRAQTYADWELLIIDDGSSDQTPGVVQPFLADSRIRYLRSDRLGQSRAKNLGIDLSGGEFVAFLDADDAWMPAKIEKQLAVFRSHPQTGVVFSRRTIIDEAGRRLPSVPATFPRGRVLPHMYIQNFVCFSSVIVRREVFSRVGRFDPEWDLAIDYDLWLRVARHYSFDFVDEEFVLYRTGHGNLSTKLADRVGTALAIMHRARRSMNEAELLAQVVAEGFASTYRTIGYTMRSSEPITALKWYGKALRWPNGRFGSIKGLAASVLTWLGGKRKAGAPENAAVNR